VVALHTKKRSFGVESISKKKKKSELVKEANKKSLETNLISLEKKKQKQKHDLHPFHLPYTYLLLPHGPKKKA
jgi:hypothetical protein